MTAATSSDRATAATDAAADAATAAAATPDDTVYCNKQLIAYLLKRVCSHGSSRNSSSNNNNNNNSHHHHQGLGGSHRRRHSGDSSRSSSPGADDSPQAQEASASANGVDGVGVVQQQQQQQQALHQRHSLDNNGSVGSDYLTASSTSALSSAPSVSPAYVSPFAMSPLSESSPWSHPAISLGVIKDRRTVELERVLLKLCNEFEQRLHDKFDNFSSKLDTEPATIRESVTHELETLFYDDNVHWGRVVAVFVLAKEICDKCMAEGRPQLAAAVQQWVAEFIDQNLWDWVHKNQGWYGLIKFYRETGGDRSALTFGSWNPVASLLTLSAVSIAIALAAAYFRR